MPTYEATRAAKDIIRETAYAVGGEVRPLPLAAMFGANEPDGWGPVYQTELLEAGHKIFPWLKWPDDIDVGDPEELAAFDAYYKDYMEYCAELGLPMYFNGTQWEGMLLGDDYETGDPETSSSVIKPDGALWTNPETGARKLSPFGLVAHWDAPAAYYMDRDSWRRLQSFYPSPPMVMFNSNNETSRLSWTDCETDSKYYVDTYGTEQTDAFKNQLFSDQWTERYQRMIATMRTTIAADSAAWASVARFTAYNACGPHEVGRFWEWQDYAIITDTAITPNWAIWDGGDYDYYANYWEYGANTLTDHSCYSNQTESCNFPFQEIEAKSINPDFLFALAIWNGDGSNTVKWWPALGYDEAYVEHSKTCQYYALGQDYDLDRYESWAQFGLWMTRPFILREFRWSTDKRANWPGYFGRLVSIVDGVHASHLKQSFWRGGTLVENADYEHPYQSNIPEQYEDAARSFLLTTSSDPERPWSLTDTVPVFALAYVLGEEGSQTWLLYAHAPLGEVANCTITVPGRGDVTLTVPRKGAFWTLDETSDPVLLPDYTGDTSRMPDYILPSRGGRVETGIIGIDEATAATHLLIPGLSGRRIAVMGLLLYANAAVTVTFGGHTSSTEPPKLNDCGAFDVAAKAGFVLPCTADPACAYFVADAGDSVYMTLGSAVQVSGIIRYAYL